MGKGIVGIIISKDGIESLSFMGKTEREKKLGLTIYTHLEEELRTLDKTIKQKLMPQARELKVKR
ncbi:hypothetical protein MYX76_12290 [Desulfobacterota bacterium AH_259_B03_O07]|nr:hypothetical protein [Desulfobacterota bacterium AH_259_B03_O07]